MDDCQRECQHIINMRDIAQTVDAYNNRRIASLENALRLIKTELSAHLNPVTGTIERGASEEQVQRVLEIIKGVL